MRFGFLIVIAIATTLPGLAVSRELLAIGDTFRGRAWEDIYTGWPQKVWRPDAESQGSAVCKGPFGLCSFSQCKIIHEGSTTSPTIAECGCYDYPDETLGKYARNLGNPFIVLDKQVKKVTRIFCNETGTCGTDVNSAPLCSSQNYIYNPDSNKPPLNRPSMFNYAFDIISTYNAYLWPNPDEVGNQVSIVILSFKSSYIVFCYTPMTIIDKF